MVLENSVIMEMILFHMFIFLPNSFFVKNYSNINIKYQINIIGLYFYLQQKLSCRLY